MGSRVIFLRYFVIKRHYYTAADKTLTQSVGERTGNLCGVANGCMAAVSTAALDGARAAVELCISLAGVLCLWSGFMELLKQCGLEAKLAALFRPLLRRLLPGACRDPETMAAVRAGCGSAAPFDILPAVWISSVLSVSVGLLTARLLERVVR